MVDIVSETQRSYNMSRIRSKNTNPEIVVRSLLHRLGYRFTVNGPKNKHLPGRPDIILPKYNTVIFVHGCFWHGHAGCKDFRLPKSRTDWWRVKIEGNMRRDEHNMEALHRLGWKVVTIWSCELSNKKKLSKLAEDLPGRLSGI